MAFVPTMGSAVGSKSFAGAAIETGPRHRVAAIRMAADTDTKESPAFGKAGKSQWKENPFTGGMPGGEAFYKAWVEDGMTKDVPDMPEFMQSRSEFKPVVEKKKGVMAMLDRTEFFKGFSRSESDADEVSDEPSQEGSATSAETAVSPQAPGDEAPDEALYAPYFPASVRNLAPEINMTYAKDFFKDRVSLAMTEVTASPADVYFPKEMKNKAPMIDINYTGNLSTSSVTVCLAPVDGLPTLPPPAKTGDAVTSLVSGPGGGLKLSYDVVGEGNINI